MSHRYREVFIYHPRGLRTGGPEALHQLGHALNLAGVTATMVPTPASRLQPRVADYDRYEVPEREHLDDRSGALVVLPETEVLLAAHVRRADVACWWLSIDNSPAFQAARRAAIRRSPGLPNALRSAKWSILAAAERLSFTRSTGRHLQHFAQSEYAWDTLNKRFGVRASLLSDYTNDGTSAIPEPRTSTAVPVVCFNGSKGAGLVRLVEAEMDRPTQFVAIEHMTPEQVRATLESSAVYLDLGEHPGKDRLPREAALAGCVVLVARRGAGAYSLDVPIPEDHKVAVITGHRHAIDPVATARQVAGVLADVGMHFDRQRFFRQAVHGERVRFVEEVDRIFVRGVLGCATSVVDLAG